MIVTKKLGAFKEMKTFWRDAHLADTILTRCTKCYNLLESVKILFLLKLQLSKPICVAYNSRCCFERYEFVQITVKAL